MSRPRIRLKYLNCSILDILEVLARFSRIAVDKVFHQQRDVLSSFLKRGYLNREDMQPINQITTEGPSADCRLQVTVCGCDHSHVSADSMTAADTFKLMLLQYTQEGNLGLGWKLSDFVEEDRASICQLKPTQALLSRAREGALLIAEQLRGDQVTGYGCAVYADEGTARPLGAPVNGACNQLLACSRFTRDENRGITWCNFGDAREHSLQSWGGPDNLFKHRDLLHFIS